MQKHGFELGINRVDNFLILNITISGTLKHSDYEIMVPMLENVLQDANTKKIKVLVDGTDLHGFEAEAAWDDFKFGIEFNDNFEKIAYIGTKSWEQYGIQIANWFTDYEMKFFENRHSAYNWLITDYPKETATQKDLSARSDEIREEINELFKKHLTITDWNVPEADDKNASEILLEIFEQEIKNIKYDIYNKG